MKGSNHKERVGNIRLKYPFMRNSWGAQTEPSPYISDGLKCDALKLYYFLHCSHKVTRRFVVLSPDKKFALRPLLTLQLI